MIVAALIGAPPAFAGEIPSDADKAAAQKLIAVAQAGMRAT
jgi:hypothetical protein